ncbi:MAG: hypothetical protein KZQ77_03495, partial [Candidatus Thiodiazotropha sp. (ex Notomyrtea botanica)]|nr:hypothetical protein [Candidatus Thiodiazotropha sp. (ex Notomyrtea botanica)]
MSTELYIQGFSADGETGLPFHEVLALFSTQSEPDANGFYSIAYDQLNSCDLSLQVADALATSVTIIRPCQHMALWAAVFELLSSAPYVAYMPGSTPVTCTPGIATHMPEGMA